MSSMSTLIYDMPLIKFSDIIVSSNDFDNIHAFIINDIGNIIGKIEFGEFIYGSLNERGDFIEDERYNNILPIFEYDIESNY